MHYDSYPNCFVQIAGLKRVKLIKPIIDAKIPRARPGLGESKAAERDVQRGEEKKLKGGEG